MTEITIGDKATGVFLGLQKDQGFNYVDELGRRHDFPVEYGERLYTEPETHTLITAPTRTGKGTSLIVPTLLEYKNSVFCIDPKGQNAAITLKQRQKLGQKCFVVNPWGLHPNHIKQKSQRINPLDLIQGKQDENAVSLAQFIADFLVMPSKESADSFWDEAGKNLLTGLILHVAANMPRSKRHLGTVRQLVTLPDSEFEKLATQLAASTLFDGALAETGGSVLSMPPNTRGSVLSTAQINTAFLSNPIVKNSLSASDFTFEQLKSEPTTVYIIIPAEFIRTQGRWLRLMVGMGLTAFERGEQFKNRCLFLVDEFPALGRMDKIANGIGVLSGFGVDMALIIQDMGQLVHHYGKDAQRSFIANCTDKYFCRIADYETAKLVSDMMGNITVQVRTTTESGSSTGQTGRALYMPEELLQKDAKTAFILRSGNPPILVEPQPYFQDKELMKLCDPDPYHMPHM